MPENGLQMVLTAAAFAAERHRFQRRKDADASPYINHPLELARILAEEGGVTDPEVIVAALLHDTVEDTETTPAEIEEKFGARVAGMVAEVTDDKSIIDKQLRKDLQVRNAPGKSHGAKLVKLADKIANLRDILARPPKDWAEAQKAQYFHWSADVVAGLRGAHPGLEARFDAVHAQGVNAFSDAA